VPTSRYYPAEDETEPNAVRFSVTLTKEQHADLELVARLWNEFDARLGIKRQHKWKLNSVLARFVSLGLDGQWEELGGRPSTAEGREEVVRVAAERVKKPHAK
jgi:hypothetical protein